MTLPDSENRRINLDYTTPLFRQVAGMEASLWFKRMGELIEMQGAIIMPNGKRWVLYPEGWSHEGGLNGWHCTTPELIELFINSLSVGFSQHKPQVESVEAGNADKGLDLKKLEEQVDTALAGEDLDR